MEHLAVSGPRIEVAPGVTLVMRSPVDEAVRCGDVLVVVLSHRALARRSWSSNVEGLSLEGRWLWSVRRRGWGDWPYTSILREEGAFAWLSNSSGTEDKCDLATGRVVDVRHVRW